jgi:hypothetical protein
VEGEHSGTTTSDTENENAGEGENLLSKIEQAANELNAMDTEGDDKKKAGSITLEDVDRTCKGISQTAQQIIKVVEEKMLDGKIDENALTELISNLEQTRLDLDGTACLVQEG